MNRRIRHTVMCAASDFPPPCVSVISLTHSPPDHNPNRRTSSFHFSSLYFLSSVVALPPSQSPFVSVSLSLVTVISSTHPVLFLSLFLFLFALAYTSAAGMGCLLFGLVLFFCCLFYGALRLSLRSCENCFCRDRRLRQARDLRTNKMDLPNEVRKIINDRR